MALLGFDDVNKLSWRKRSEPFEQYFGDTDLTDEEKRKRIELAEELDDLMLFLLALIALMQAGEYIDREYVYEQATSRYMSIVERYMGIDEYIDNYIRNFSNTFLDTTLERMEDEWYLSSDRAAFVAENESESVWNYDEYRQAIASGKKYKRWVDIRDNRERKTHRKVGGTELPIEEIFNVGNSMMRFPKDTALGAEPKELINCRCTIQYY